MSEIQFSLYIYFPKGKKGCILKKGEELYFIVNPCTQNKKGKKKEKEKRKEKS